MCCLLLIEFGQRSDETDEAKYYMDYKKIFLLLFLPSVSPVYAEDHGSGNGTESYALPAEYESLSGQERDQWLRLLHYENGTSTIIQPTTFFLSPEGNTNPAAEYKETLTHLANDSDFHCRYPARFRFITGKKAEVTDCKDLNEFREYVHIDSMYAVIAGNDAVNPVSAMGHGFLMIESTNVFGVSTRYAVNYGARSLMDAPFFETLYEVINNSMDGAYYLELYDDTVHKYISEEDRSLWEFQIRLSQDEKDLLEDHLFELKGHNIHYSIVSNNCANGAEQLLSAVSGDFFDNDPRFFSTPYLYAQHLSRVGRMTGAVSIRPGKSDIYAIGGEYIQNPLSIRKPSRLTYISMFGSENSYSELTFSPLFHDINSDGGGITEISGSEFLRFTGRYYNQKHSFVFNRFTLLDLEIHPNILAAGTFAKSINISFEGNEFDYHTRLYPSVTGGLGISARFGDFIPYADLIAGVHFIPGNQFLLGIRSGFFISSETAGKIHGRFLKNFADDQSWKGSRYQFELSWSKKILDELSIEGYLKANRLTRKNRFDRLFGAGITWTF